MTNVLVLLVVLQSSLRLSQWKNHWLRWGFALVVGLAVFFSVDIAASLSKPQVAAWLSTTSVLQDVAVLCLLDALLLRVRWYPGLLGCRQRFYDGSHPAVCHFRADTSSVGRCTRLAVARWRQPSYASFCGHPSCLSDSPCPPASVFLPFTSSFSTSHYVFHLTNPVRDS